MAVLLTAFHIDATLSRKSRLVAIRQLFIHGNVGMRFSWPDVLPYAKLHEPFQFHHFRRTGNAVGLLVCIKEKVMLLSVVHTEE